MQVHIPHGNQITGTDDQRLQIIVILHNACKGGCHQCLAQTDHVADNDASTLVQMVRGNFDCGSLVVEETFLKDARNTKIGQASACLFGEVIDHLQVDIIRREHL